MIAKPGAEYELALISTELYPFTRGGIGVLNANLMREFGSDGLRILFVNMGDVAIDAAQFRSAFPHCAFVNAWQLLKNQEVLPAEAFSRSSDWHFRSYAAKRCLEVLGDRDVRIGVAEFQDFGGLGAESLLCRRSIASIRDARVSVRVHGPFGVLRLVHGYPGWLPHLAVADLERTAFTRADDVIFHAPGVVGAVEAAFRLSPLGARAVIQRPPVGLANDMSAPLGLPQKSRVLFPSKVESWKNTRDFLMATRLLEARRAGPVEAVVAGALSDHDRNAAQLLSMLTDERPAGLHWLPSPNAATRAMLMGTSAVVVSSPFEAFCLVAYESALLGGRPILNSENPAFDSDSVWRDGGNCWLYDGTVGSLAEVMDKALDTNLSAPLKWEADALPYWPPSLGESRQRGSERDSDALGVAQRDHIDAEGRDQEIDIIVTNAGLSRFLPEAMQSIARQSLAPMRVILVNDGETNPEENSRHLEAVLGAIPLTIVNTPTRLGLSRARNIGFAQSSAPLVAFLDADDMLEPSYLHRAARGLAENADADVFVPFAMPFENEVDYWVGQQPNIWTFLVDTFFTRYVTNWISTASCVIRRTVLPSHPFDESLDLLEDWDLWCRLQELDVRFTTDHRLGLWYRQRSDSMMARARGSATEGASVDRIRAKAWGAGSLTAAGPALTDGATVQVAGGDRFLGVLDIVAQKELARLTAVEREAGAVLGRRAVRMALSLTASLRPRASRGDSELPSVFSPGVGSDTMDPP